MKVLVQAKDISLIFMNFSIQKSKWQDTPGDILALFWTPNGPFAGAAAEIDTVLDGALSALALEESFKAQPGDVLMWHSAHASIPHRVVLCGVGETKRITDESLRSAAAAAVNVAKKLPKATLNIALDIPIQVGAFEAGKAVSEGIRLAAYRFGMYKTLEAEGPAQVNLLLNDANAFKSAEEGFKLGALFAAGTVMARDLVNQSGGHLTPLELAKAAGAAVKGKKGVTIMMIHKAELKKLGAGGILGVGQGSDHDPVLVHMVYKPAKKAKKTIALVGKAITFDSGGLSIKSAGGMETMKCDMAGAAAVIGAFSVIGQVKPDVEVHGIFGACENMVSGNALRPGDVVKTLNGKTIEILNTDAEGRVTLADTLAYAAKLNPDAIIDLATLTGACVVALGEEITALMSNDPILATRIKAAADEAGEKVWEMPLEKNYKSEIKSDVADYKNTTSRWGGTLTAGLLLEEFVDGKPWVHLDIAGPAFAEKPLNAYTKKGGTGHGVRTLLEYLRGL